MNSEDQHLRALELNSWQLLRLLQAQLSGLPCRNFPCDEFGDHQTAGSSGCYHRTDNVLCCLYLEAAALYNSWKSKRGSEWVFYVSLFIITIMIDIMLKIFLIPFGFFFFATC